MQYNVKKKIRSKMKPIVNENEMSTNADVMDMTMLIILLYLHIAPNNNINYT